MDDPFMDSGPVVTVCVALDRHSSALTQTAAAICQRTGKRLCLLHVVEPWAEVPQSRPLGASDPLWDVTQAVERDARDKAQARLDELVMTVPKDVLVFTRVVSGKPVEELMREAAAHRSCLLVVGANFGNLKFVPRGLSTALSLMVSSPIPVLVADAVAQEPPVAALPGPTRLVVADDLGDDCLAAVEYALGFAAALGRVDVRHVHVNGLTLGNLKAGLETAAAASHTLQDSSASAERVLEALLLDLGDRLVERSESLRDYVEAAGGSYGSEVRTGITSEQLQDVATTFAPHLMVFGRHQAFHTQPFFVGRVPFRAMLTYQRPLLIVPRIG